MAAFYDPRLDPSNTQAHRADSPVSSSSVPSTHPHTPIHDSREPARSRKPSSTSRAPKRSAPMPNARASFSRKTLEHASPSDGGEEEEDLEDEEARAEAKRRKVQRACDLCRRKKIKCDAWDNGKNGQCSNCDEGSLRCTYVEAAKRRGPPPGYVDTLEWKLHRVEELVRRLSPDHDLARDAGPPIQRESFIVANWKKQCAHLGVDLGSSGGGGQGKARIGGKTNVGIGPGVQPGSTHGKLTSPVLFEDEYEIAPCLDDPKVYATKARMFNPDGTLTTGVMSDRQIVKTLAGDPHQGQGSISGSQNGDGSRGGGCTLEEEEEYKNQELANHFSDVHLEGYRYHGKASGVQLLRTVMDYKYADESSEPKQQQERYLSTLVNSRRPALWVLPVWEATVANGAVQNIDMSQWPDADLAQSLLDAYFEADNMMLPLLNQKIFQADYDRQRYRHDHGWAKVCLLVFANAARLVDDPRVYWYADEPSKAQSYAENMEVYKQSAGWRFMETTIKAGKNILSPAVLEDLQIHVLVSSFLMRSAVLHVVYSIAGNGLRAAQDLGVHTRISASRIQDRAQAELHNRAFWCLIWLDRICCAGMGRTISLQDEDFDVEYPLAVDDEYWDTGEPATNFLQPANVPSKMAYFVSVLKLLRVIERVLKKVYSVSDGDRQRETGPEAQQQLVAELDSDLYSWLDGVPDCLRWDPHRKDPVLFQQSCLLYSIYYFTEILIHRPFIPMPKSEHPKPLAVGFPSLAICTNAARSCSHVIEAHNQRCPPNITMMLPAFTSSVVLLIGVWGGKGSGSKAESSAALADVRKCLQCMKAAEVHWRAAGRMRDIVTELANLSETSLATPSPAASASTPPPKRSRGGGATSAVSSTLASPAAHLELGTERQVRNLPRSVASALPVPAVSAARMESPQKVEQQNTQPPVFTGQAPDSQPWFMQTTPAVYNPSQFQQAPSNFGTYGASALTKPEILPGSSLLNGAPGPPPFPTPMSPNGIERLLNGQSNFGNGVGNGLSTFGSSGLQMADPQQQWQAGPSQYMMGDAGNMGYDQQGQGVQDQALYDVAGMTWPYGMTSTPADAIQSGGVMADIWSMAPDTFEMDAWISYLQQAAPAGGESGYQQNMY